MSADQFDYTGPDPTAILAADVLWTLMQNVDTNVAAIQSFLVTAKANGSWAQISNLIGEKIEAQKKLTFDKNKVSL